MQLFLKSPNGTSTIDLALENTLENVLTNEGVSTENNRFIYNGKQMDTNRCLFEYGFKGLETIYVTGRICGGKLTDDDKVLAITKFEKQVCRKCYARLPIRATHCRKRACGYSSKLRGKKKRRDESKK
ncbi:Ubiquitin [Spraguea lophii 42_110]|uniref:Ubiquitin n=1 Tax=Spraguea lophii (strain 42_110) TaxID=1358809 RepID=S7XSQ3_SPRLO|nr:Chain LMM, Ubiquitin [Spraguea lophii 42_110]7QJH_KMM Chain KMM, Ubiquitin [Spraguea lophii 42_110]7QJH_LMM Chain LMM, Ubiquitin [Spraguea lophii 42_110]8BR3_LMM Chain LMM, Ubiquitin [Spraguea lophii 42_110]8P5D_LMM Chain LMM, Ubiquitin [Spraguea lophii 42_110]8P60_KMM Chain KMM, Ubiquitin [Spraguea lophii 42_110]8P60_LMM Chain LMM, Ubiquitin [Spraguea lophii 42_110]EPR78953.1 Ubiquitin [Spraguea lophii 42_110]